MPRFVEETLFDGLIGDELRMDELEGYRTLECIDNTIIPSMKSLVNGIG